MDGSTQIAVRFDEIVITPNTIAFFYQNLLIHEQEYSQITDQRNLTIEGVFGTLILTQYPIN